MQTDLELALKFTAELKRQNADLLDTVSELTIRLEEYRQSNQLLTEYLEAVRVHIGSEVKN